MEATAVILEMRVLAGELRAEAEAHKSDREFGEALLTRAHRDGRADGLMEASERILRALEKR